MTFWRTELRPGTQIDLQTFEEIYADCCTRLVGGDNVLVGSAYDHRKILRLDGNPRESNTETGVCSGPPTMAIAKMVDRIRPTGMHCNLPQSDVLWNRLLEDGIDTYLQARLKGDLPDMTASDLNEERRIALIERIHECCSQLQDLKAARHVSKGIRFQKGRLMKAIGVLDFDCRSKGFLQEAREVAAAIRKKAKGDDVVDVGGQTRAEPRKARERYIGGGRIQKAKTMSTTKAPKAAKASKAIKLMQGGDIPLTWTNLPATTDATGDGKTREGLITSSGLETRSTAPSVVAKDPNQHHYGMSSRSRKLLQKFEQMASGAIANDTAGGSAEKPFRLSD